MLSKESYTQIIAVGHQIMMAHRDNLIVPFCRQELPGSLEKRRIDDEERDAHEMSLDHLYASLMHKTCTRDAHHMLCPVSVIKRQVQRTSCHKSPTPHHPTPTCHLHPLYAFK
mmetsp:Transcript_81037/g.131307  ORF Transcript_81037/g.131307 Transcript_81037/m.131307 type:complete len:113 (-) Transcript_81037:214-552(-)